MIFILPVLRGRLTRFGFNCLERYFGLHGVRVEVVEESEKEHVEAVIEDFVSIITSLAARIYGKRSQKFRKIKRLWRR